MGFLGVPGGQILNTTGIGILAHANRLKKTENSPLCRNRKISRQCLDFRFLRLRGILFFAEIGLRGLFPNRAPAAHDFVRQIPIKAAAAAGTSGVRAPF